MALGKKNLLRQLFYCPVILVIASLYSQCFAATEISNIRHWTAPDHTRVVFDLSEEPDYQFQIKDNILTLEFSNASFHQLLPSEKMIGKPGINKIIFTTADNNKCKIEIVLDQYLKAEVFKLKKFMNKPDRVVVDIVVAQAVPEEIVKEQTLPSVKKRVIVIDPGHGGDDPGAVGKNGTYEKNIVLSVGREIKKEINKLPGYRAVLTRDGDYYVSFKKRLQTAKDFNASLFISVHADAARNRRAKGSSIYCLSTGAASNEAAKLLAKNENLSDIIGGVPNGEGKNDSDQIILNMFQTNTINLSKTYAGNLLHQMDKINCLKYKNVQEAPFRVLKLPDIPAVLIETAYISNAQEERLLKNSNFQKKLARAVASSVTEYLSFAAPLPGGGDKDKIVQSSGKKLPEKTAETDVATTRFYRVKRADTLFSIAKRFNTKVAVLLKINNLKMEEPLLTGRKILVPFNPDAESVKIDGSAAGMTGKSNNTKAVTGKYMVKKGDTLYSLAKSNSITIAELRKLNNMQSNDILVVGQRIKLP